MCVCVCVWCACVRVRFAQFWCVHSVCLCCVSGVLRVLCVCVCMRARVGVGAPVGVDSEKLRSISCMEHEGML